MDIKETLGTLVFMLLCLAPFILVFIVPSFWAAGKMSNQIRKEHEDYVRGLLERGVTYPADILVVNSTGRSRKLSGGVREVQVEFVVEVHPEGQPDFQSSFKFWVPRRAPVGGLSKRIWVTYDPNDTRQMILHHYEHEHEEYLAKKDWVRRRNEFIDAEKEAIRVRETGEEAMAVILTVQELNVEADGEKKDGKTLHLKFRVTPKSGFPFESETYGMFAHESMPKLTAGRKVYVKFDPNKPEISALMRAVDP